MKVVQITDIQRKAAAIEYRRMYTGNAVLDLNGAEAVDIPIEFALEQTALGAVDISVNLLKQIEHPVVPVIDTLKEHIRVLSAEGQLR